MKKTKILGTLTVSAATLLLLGGTAFAAKVDSKDTDGTVKFTVDDGAGNIIEPDPADDKDIIIKMPSTEGKSGTGAIRIQFVPNFRFGSHDGISAAAAKRPVELLKMNDETNAAKGLIAPFVQITDGRGVDGAEASWALTASATKFANATGTHDLGNSGITLEGSTLTTTMGDSTLAEGMVEGQTKGVKISTDATSPTPIMKTKLNQSTNGYQVSNVFHDNYTKGMTYPAITDIQNAADSTKGVMFEKVANVSPLKDVTYTSTITWTLTDAK